MSGEGYDEFGEDEEGRELVAARAAAEGRYIIFELAGGYLAIPAGTELVTDMAIDP